MLDENCKEFVSNLLNHLMIRGTFESFVANMQNDLDDHQILEGFGLNIQNHVVIYETL